MGKSHTGVLFRPQPLAIPARAYDLCDTHTVHKAELGSGPANLMADNAFMAHFPDLSNVPCAYSVC